MEWVRIVYELVLVAHRPVEYAEEARGPEVKKKKENVYIYIYEAVRHPEV